MSATCETCGETWPPEFLNALTRTFDLAGCPACNGEEWKASVPPGVDTGRTHRRRAEPEPAAHH